MNIINDKLSLLHEDLECDEFKVIHFKKYLNSYAANIICCEFKNEKDLEKYWSEVVDNVAVHIQAELHEIIELFNVYIFFFVSHVDDKLIYTIEQDKYSSRKIVVKCEIPTDIEILKNIIEERIFKFGIEKIETDDKLDNWLREYDGIFYNFLWKIEGNESENLDKAIEILK